MFEEQFNMLTGEFPAETKPVTGPVSDGLGNLDDALSSGGGATELEAVAAQVAEELSSGGGAAELEALAKQASDQLGSGGGAAELEAVAAQVAEELSSGGGAAELESLAKQASDQLGSGGGAAELEALAKQASDQLGSGGGAAELEAVAAQVAEELSSGGGTAELESLAKQASDQLGSGGGAAELEAVAAQVAEELSSGGNSDQLALVVQEISGQLAPEPDQDNQILPIDLTLPTDFPGEPMINPDGIAAIVTNPIDAVQANLTKAATGFTPPTPGNNTPNPQAQFDAYSKAFREGAALAGEALGNQGEDGRIAFENFVNDTADVISVYTGSGADQATLVAPTLANLADFTSQQIADYAAMAQSGGGGIPVETAFAAFAAGASAGLAAGIDQFATYSASGRDIVKGIADEIDGSGIPENLNGLGGTGAGSIAVQTVKVTDAVAAALLGAAQPGDTDYAEVAVAAASVVTNFTDAVLGSLAGEEGVVTAVGAGVSSGLIDGAATVNAAINAGEALFASATDGVAAVITAGAMGLGEAMMGDETQPGLVGNELSGPYAQLAMPLTQGFSDGASGLSGAFSDGAGMVQAALSSGPEQFQTAVIEPIVMEVSGFDPTGTNTTGPLNPDQFMEMLDGGPLAEIASNANTLPEMITGQLMP